MIAGRLVYLCYGRGPWIEEIEYSILSSLRWIDAELGGRTFVVLSDVETPALSRLPCQVERIDPSAMAAWAGPMSFNHRRKILALTHVLDRFGGSAILLDGDTYFTRSPMELFDRVGHGRSIMHMYEGTLGTVQGEMHRELFEHLCAHAPSDADGAIIPPRSDMWNAGVIGMHADDRHLLDKVLWLADNLYERLRIHTAEQFAFSHVLGRHTARQKSSDVVFHYWLPYLHDAFRAELPELLERCRHLSLAQRARRLHACRPRPRGIKRLKLLAKPVAQRLGLGIDRMRAQG